MQSENLVILVGNVGADPEIRATGTGKNVANFTLATTAKWTGANGELNERTDWHKVVCWEPLSKYIEAAVMKGTRVYIKGRLQYEKWTDKGGQSKTTANIVAASAMVLSGGKAFQESNRRNNQGEDQKPVSRQPPPSIDDDDIPF